MSDHNGPWVSPYSAIKQEDYLFNPAAEYLPVLEKYLPRIGVTVKQAWAVYKLEPHQIAALILLAQQEARGE